MLIANLQHFLVSVQCIYKGLSHSKKYKESHMLVAGYKDDGSSENEPERETPKNQKINC